MIKNFLPTIADIVASAAVLLPLLLFWLYGSKGGRSHRPLQKAAIVLLALYLLAVCSEVGIPSIKYLRPDFSFNLLPLLDITDNPPGYICNTVLNILLFVPLGLLLPAIWPQYRSLKRLALTGLGFSLSIEILQMFCWRLTDVDDLWANTLGTVAGFYLWQLVCRLLKKQPSAEAEQGSIEPWLIWLACLLITMFVYPFLPEPLRNWFLYTPLWQ